MYKYKIGQDARLSKEELSVRMDQPYLSRDSGEKPEIAVRGARYTVHKGVKAQQVAVTMDLSLCRTLTELTYIVKYIAIQHQFMTRVCASRPRRMKAVTSYIGCCFKPLACHNKLVVASCRILIVGSLLIGCRRRIRS